MVVENKILEIFPELEENINSTYKKKGNAFWNNYKKLINKNKLVEHFEKKKYFYP